MDGPASYADRADAARVLVGVFVVALPLVCMTIVAAVMITPTTVWGDWQWRLPGIMRMLETMLRWRTIPLSICGLCAAAMTVGLLVEWRDAWHRCVPILSRFVRLLVAGCCCSTFTVAPSLWLCVGLRSRFEQCHPLEDGDCSAIVAMAPLSLTVAFSTAVTSSCCFVAGWFVAVWAVCDVAMWLWMCGCRCACACGCACGCRCRCRCRCRCCYHNIYHARDQPSSLLLCGCATTRYRRGEPRVGHKARRSRRMSASGNTATARAAADRVMAALQSQMGSLQQAASSSTTTGSGSDTGGGKAAKTAGSGGARRRKR